MARRRRAYQSLEYAHPYITAELKFCAGKLTVAQAVAMIISDPDYIAECELTGRNKRSHAEAIVRGPWAKRYIYHNCKARQAA